MEPHSSLILLHRLVGFYSVVDNRRKLTVNPIHPFIIPTKALHIAQIEEAQPKAPRLLLLRYSFQPLRNDAFSWDSFC